MTSSASPDPVVADSVLRLIGHTPLVRVRRMDTGPCELYLKLESQNPGGSIKDRVALAMVEAAEKDGALKPGGRIFEATAGNTGLGLALIAAQKGYKLTLVIPDKMSQEKVFHLRALGAEVMMTRSDVTKGHPDYYQDMAARLAAAAGGFYVNQFANPANPLAHEHGTGPEIWAQMGGRLDAMVCGVGSGGTLTGLGRYFARVAPQLAMVLADPEGSILAPYVRDGVLREAGSWLVEGIGEDFIPQNCELGFVQQAYSISDAESIATARAVLRDEGILCGSSSGTLIAAALRYCRAQQGPKRVVTLVCDSGNKYLSKIFNEFWLDEQGMAGRTATRDLRDLIARPLERGQVVAAAAGDRLQQVYTRMKLYDVSQVPVMADGKVIGLVDEMDILQAVAADGAHFELPVERVMAQRIETVQAGQGIDDVMALFRRGMVACVYEGTAFLGLITPTDVLNYMRLQAKRS